MLNNFVAREELKCSLRFLYVGGAILLVVAILQYYSFRYMFNGLFGRFELTDAEILDIKDPDRTLRYSVRYIPSRPIADTGLRLSAGKMKKKYLLLPVRDRWLLTFVDEDHSDAEFAGSLHQLESVENKDAMALVKSQFPEIADKILPYALTVGTTMQVFSWCLLLINLILIFVGARQFAWGIIALFLPYRRTIVPLLKSMSGTEDEIEEFDVPSSSDSVKKIGRLYFTRTWFVVIHWFELLIGRNDDIIWYYRWIKKNAGNDRSLRLVIHTRFATYVEIPTKPADLEKMLRFLRRRLPGVPDIYMPEVDQLRWSNSQAFVERLQNMRQENLEKSRSSDLAAVAVREPFALNHPSSNARFRASQKEDENPADVFPLGESFIRSEVHRRNWALLGVATLALSFPVFFLVVGINYTTEAYQTSSSITAEELLKPGAASEWDSKMVEFTAPKVIDTGRRRGNKKLEKKFLLATVKDHFLIVVAPLEHQGNLFVGILRAGDGAEWGDQIRANNPQAADKLLSYHLDCESPGQHGEMGITLLCIGIPGTLLGLWMLSKPLTRFVMPWRHPMIRQLAKFGHLRTTIEEIDHQISETNCHYEWTVKATPSWIIAHAECCTTVVRMRDVVWYFKVNQDKVKVFLRDHRVVEIHVNRKKRDSFFEYVLAHAPNAWVGYNVHLEQAWNTDPARFIRDYDEKRER